LFGCCGFALARIQPVFHSKRLTANGNDLGMMEEAIEQCCCQNLILECIIMPLSLIVLLVEANLGAV